MLHTIAAFHNFMQSNGISLKGVSLTVEFDDYSKALWAWEKVLNEFSPSLRFELPKKAPISPLTLMDVPVRFVAKVGG